MLLKQPMASPELDPNTERDTQARVADLRQRGARLVERLYGPRIRYHLDQQQIQLDGEPLPADLFYLVLHRDHGLRMPKPMAQEIVMQVAQRNPYSAPQTASTDPYLPKPVITPALDPESSPKFSPAWQQWMLQVRSILQKKWIT